MDWLVKWYQAHTQLTHAIAVAIASLVTAYYQVPVFQSYVNAIYGDFPTSIKNLVAVSIALYGFYRNGQKPA